MLDRDRDLEAFPSAIGKDGYPATVGAASRRRDFGNRSVVMTAIVKVLPEPPVGLQFAPARFLEEDRMKKDMRIAALPVALLSIVVGIAGIASPDGGMMLRRLYFATPALFYAVVAVRSAMARADPGCLELSLAQDPAGVGSRDVPASTCGDALRT